MTTDQKKRIKRAGDSRLPFLQKALNYAQQHPEVLAGTFKLPEFAKDIAFISNFNIFLAALKSFSELSLDTQALAETDGYEQARDVYDAFKRANRNGEYDAIVADLGLVFKEMGAKPATPPTP